MASVTIYTSPTCGWCKKTKAFLKEKGVKFKEIDVTTNEKGRDAAIEKSGQMGVPVIDIDGKILVGFNPVEIEKALE